AGPGRRQRELHRHANDLHAGPGVAAAVHVPLRVHVPDHRRWRARRGRPRLPGGTRAGRVRHTRRPDQLVHRGAGLLVHGPTASHDPVRGPGMSTVLAFWARIQEPRSVSITYWRVGV